MSITIHDESIPKPTGEIVDLPAPAPHPMLTRAFMRDYQRTTETADEKAWLNGLFCTSNERLLQARLERDAYGNEVIQLRRQNIALYILVAIMAGLLLWGLMLPVVPPVSKEPALEVEPYQGSLFWNEIEIDGETNTFPVAPPEINPSPAAQSSTLETGESSVVGITETVTPLTYHITHYGATGNEVARGGLPEFWDAWAIEHGYTGIVAVSGDTPWYWRFDEEPPVIIHIGGHGDFVVVDRTAFGNDRNLDIFGLNKNRGTERATAWEVTE